MKKFLIFVALVHISSFTFAAKEPLGDITEIVELSNTTQAQAYNASKMWFANAFKSANNVIQYDDAATGTIIGKGNMDYPCKGAWNCLGHPNYKVSFTIKVNTKDNKARLLFSDLQLHIPASTTSGVFIKAMDVPIYAAKDKEVITEEFYRISQEFKSNINTSKNDEW